jgi:hypothetical protein
MYDTMAAWETDAALAAQSDDDSSLRLSITGEDDRPVTLVADFATAWQVASKVVYSTTMAAVSTADTRLERQ